MDLVSIARSEAGPRLAMALCRVLPRWIAYAIGEALAGQIARCRDLPLIRGLSANQAVLYGLPAGRVLQAVVRMLLANALHSYIDLFRLLQSRPESWQRICHPDRAALELMERCRAQARGVVLVGAHNVGFDLMLMTMGKRYPDMQILSTADPQGSSGVMNAIRQEFGLRITPISPATLREALCRLRRGGLVAIAADLPSSNGAEFSFFGRRCRLGYGHARLALSAQAEMIVAGCQRLGPGSYRVTATPSPAPAPTGEARTDAIHWAQSTLRILEDLIADRPDEWFMPLPLWEAPQPARSALRSGVTMRPAPDGLRR